MNANGMMKCQKKCWYLFPFATWVMGTSLGMAMLPVQAWITSSGSLDHPLPYLTAAPLSTLAIYSFWTAFVPFALNRMMKRNVPFSFSPKGYAAYTVAIFLGLDILVWGVALPIVGIVYFSFLAPWIGYGLIYALVYITLKKKQSPSLDKS